MRDTRILGYAYALSGRIAEVIPLLEHALSAIKTMGLGLVQPLFLVSLGEAYVLADRLEDAVEVAGRARPIVHERGQCPYEAWTLRLLGEVTARRTIRARWPYNGRGDKGASSQGALVERR